MRDAESMLRKTDDIFILASVYLRPSIVFASVHAQSSLPSSPSVYSRKCVTECDAVSFHTCATTRDVRG